FYAAGWDNNYPPDYGIAKSTDAGVHWILNATVGQITSLQSSPAAPELFFANLFPSPNTPGRVVRTADAGVTWRAVTGLGQRALPIPLAIAPSDASVVYATYGRGGDLFASKFDPHGNPLFTVTTGGFGDKTLARIRVDASGRIYIAGSTNSLDLPGDSPAP